MPLDRLLGDEERLRDLAIRAALRRLAADPPLGWSQSIRARELEPRATPGPGAQLGPRSVDEGNRAAPASQLDRAPFGIASLATPPGTAQLAPEIGECVGQLQLRCTSLKDGGRLRQQR